MKSPKTGKISHPNIGPGNGGNLPYHKVGDGVPGKPPGQGPSGTHGSYSKGCPVGTAKAK